MKLKRFLGKKIHGYRTIDISFAKDLTFLTGINGSGKTTVLNAIISLITPSFAQLFELSFDLIRLDFTHEETDCFVEAKQSDDKLTLTSSASNIPLVLKHFPAPIDASPDRDFEQEFYREAAAEHSSHPVMKFIAALPTPMYLPLDRRARFSSDRPTRAMARPRRLQSRNIFNTTLFRSISEAVSLAETTFRDALIAEARLAEEFRREMLLDLLKVEPMEGHSGFSLSLPTDKDRKDISAMRKYVGDLPRILRLPVSEVESRILPFLDLLENTAREIPSNKTLKQMMAPAKTTNNPDLKALFTWSVNSSQLKTIRLISEKYSSFNKRYEELNEPKNRYLRLLNGFLNDSGKEVSADANGYISFSIDGFDDTQPVSSLSSGEAQIFVILTQLSFNPLASRANVFIVDEPELSLHVHWQELLVDSMQKANPNIQYLMATHSPSIILEKIDRCVDISFQSTTAKSLVPEQAMPRKNSSRRRK